MQHRILLLCVFILSLVGCAHYPVNGPLAGRKGGTGYRFANLPATADNSDDLFVVLALSGGGARAAAFSYGVLEQLQTIPISVNGRTTSLLDEVDVLSPASASSFTAAHYALHHYNTFQTFPKRFFESNLQTRVVGATANPLNWPRLGSPTFDRIDLAAETYDAELFDHYTFADLAATHRRPYLLLSATDVSLGRRFEFTQEQFDCLNSDLSSVPIGRAVAASAAFPVAFNPITFENHATGNLLQEPAWIRDILANPKAPAALLTRARDLRSYANSQTRKHIRLLDGAISDYSGLVPVMQAYTSPIGDFSIRRLIDEGRIKRLVVIAVNAVRTPGVAWDAHESAPGWADMLYMTASEPIRNRAYEIIARFRELLEEETARQSGKLDARLVTIDFESIKDPALRDRLEQIPTKLSLKKQEFADLRRAAAEAIRDSAEVQKLFADLRPETGR